MYRALKHTQRGHFQMIIISSISHHVNESWPPHASPPVCFTPLSMCSGEQTRKSSVNDNFLLCLNWETLVNCFGPNQDIKPSFEFSFIFQLPQKPLTLTCDEQSTVATWGAQGSFVSWFTAEFSQGLSTIHHGVLVYICIILNF